MLFLFTYHHFFALCLEGWTTDRTDRTLVAFSPNPTVQLRLPAGTDDRSLVNTIVYIRNKLGCVTEFNISSVVVISDCDRIMNLVKILQTPNNQINKHPLARILANGNQNNVDQIIISLSQRFNQINQQTIHDALASKIMINNPSPHIIYIALRRRNTCCRYICLNLE